MEDTPAAWQLGLNPRMRGESHGGSTPLSSEFLLCGCYCEFAISPDGTYSSRGI